MRRHQIYRPNRRTHASGPAYGAARQVAEKPTVIATTQSVTLNEAKGLLSAPQEKNSRCFAPLSMTKLAFLHFLEFFISGPGRSGARYTN